MQLSAYRASWLNGFKRARGNDGFAVGCIHVVVKNENRLRDLGVQGLVKRTEIEPAKRDSHVTTNEPDADARVEGRELKSEVRERAGVTVELVNFEAWRRVAANKRGLVRLWLVDRSNVLPKDIIAHVDAPPGRDA